MMYAGWDGPTDRTGAIGMEGRGFAIGFEDSGVLGS